MAEGTVFVQRSVHVPPPMSLAKLREIIKDLPDDAMVEIDSGELIEINWHRHE